MEVIEEFKPIIDKFTSNNCSMEEALSFIYNNVELVRREDFSLDKMVFIYNNKDIYGLIYVYDNKYDWSIYLDNEFSKVKSSNHSSVSESDYIVEMMVNVGNSKKVSDIVPEIKDMNTEGKIKTLRKIGLNSKGYHFK